jgi:cellulose synthase/poly-beta-1,6-N-acetylglucosamine synthase-like glycosyltransferase
MKSIFFISVLVLGIFAQANRNFHNLTMGLTVFLFWLSLGVLFYCYIGYGILLLLINGSRKLFSQKKQTWVHETLPVTLIIPAYNEYNVLPEKIKNSLSLDYPPELLSVIVITDGSDDGSAQLIQQYPGITGLHQPKRKGKFAAIKRAMRTVTTTIVVFSDANTMLNKESISRLVKHYTDPKVGGVAGEKKIFRNSPVSAVGEAEGFYWKYESIMKQLEARFQTVVGAAGELFSIRSGLFTDHNDEVILDDFMLSMSVCLQGYKIVYESGAFASEMPSVSLAEEEKRKVRISAGAYQSIGLLSGKIDLVKHPLLAFQYFSRRLLRWIFCPWMLVILFIMNAILAGHHPGIDLFDWTFYTQCLFYLLAVMGWYFLSRGKKTGMLAIPFYFLFMNYCLVKGFFRFLRGDQSSNWEKSLRMDKVKG